MALPAEAETATDTWGPVFKATWPLVPPRWQRSARLCPHIRGVPSLLRAFISTALRDAFWPHQPLKDHKRFTLPQVFDVFLGAFF